MTRSAGASYVRLTARWLSIAPATLPDGFNASDPTSPAYTWSGVDATVEAAEAAGLTPILDIATTPRWAYAHSPSGVNAGSPRAAALGDFAQALATHFDGENGLPAVGIYEVWNEPNLSLDLSPVKASIYRSMINAVASGVHGLSNPANIVVAGGHGSVRPSEEQEAVVVLRLSARVYALAAMRLEGGDIPIRLATPRFISTSGPTPPIQLRRRFGKASVADDVELGDLPRMRAVLQAGIRLHQGAPSRLIPSSSG